MRIGINGTGLVQSASVDKVSQNVEEAAGHGFASYWLAEHPTGGFDALTVLALAGTRVPDIELGTAIVPTHPRHPIVLAGQTRTVADMLGARLTLGIGLSHAVMMEDLGVSFEKPIRHMREYLSVLMPLLTEGEVDFAGETIQCRGKFFGRPDVPVSVLFAALGPQALAVAGRMTDGTTLAWVGPRTVAEHIAPRLQESAAAAGRASPRIVATLPVCVTEQPDVARDVLSKNMTMYTRLPSYQAMFDREGVAGPADVAIIGSRAEVEDGIGRMADAGVTDFAPSEFFLNTNERANTRELLTALL